MDKYYIPTISEFHVGFEYEELEFVYTDKGWHIEKKNKFVKKVFEGTNYLESYYLTERVKRGLFHFSIRVKYLDREDIESLGFSFMENESPYDIRDLMFVKNNIKLIYSFQKNKIVLLKTNLIDNLFPNISILFEGKLKNKSELKTLLKQIGIE
jgi:hypothetical protein